MGRTDLNMKINAAQIMKQKDKGMQLQNGHLLPTGEGKGRGKSSTQVQGNKHIFSPIHHV